MTTEERLKEFFRWAMNYAWGGDIDGADVQDRALKLGLIERTEYDPAKHGPLPEEFEGLVDPGDEWFVLSPDVQLKEGGT